MPRFTRQPDAPLRAVSLLEGGLAIRLGHGPLQLGFRPVAELEQGHAAGYEAVLGSPEDPRDLDTPAAWSRRGHAAQAGSVEARLVREALSARAALPPGAFLLVSVSAGALVRGELPAAFDEAGDLARVVVAVCDDADPQAVSKALEGVRGAGARVAVDDAGGGVASLEQIVRLRPDLVRVGATFTAELDRDPARAAVVEALVAVASRIDARVLAGEVPGAPELRALMRIGVALAQGPVLGEAPEPTMEALTGEARAAIASGRMPWRYERTVTEALEPLEPLADGTSTAEIADRFLADPRHGSLVTVDSEGHPVALLDRAALLRGEPHESVPLVVQMDDALTEVARRAVSRASDERLRPLVIGDARGRYLGIVRIERLLEALASGGDGDGGERRRPSPGAFGWRDLTGGRPPGDVT